MVFLGPNSIKVVYVDLWGRYWDPFWGTPPPVRTEGPPGGERALSFRLLLEGDPGGEV